MPARYDDRDPDDEPDPLGRWRKGRDGEYWPSILRSASNSRHGGITLKRRRADNVEAFGGQLRRVWFNDDVDLNRVND